jgi:flagellar biosynthetic protein FlhB
VRIRTLIQWFTFKVLSPAATLKYSLLCIGALLTLGIGLVAVASVLASVLQTKGLVTTKQIIPDLARLQPLGYVRRLREGFVDASMGMVRVAVLVSVLGPLLVTYLWQAPVLFRAPGEWVVPGIARYLESAVIRGLGVMVFLGSCAYLLVWWRFLREHRMSFEEVKEECKESEGDPHLRAARKHEHQALAMAEIEKRVRNSKVLVIRKRPLSVA